MPFNPGKSIAMGAFSMSCSLRFLLPVMILAVPVAALTQSQPRLYPNLGTPLSQAEIQSFDRMIGPEGKELPAGHGTVKEGAETYVRRCEICHGKNGENGLLRSLVIGRPGQPYRGTFYGEEKNSPSYYPYATITSLDGQSRSLGSLSSTLTCSLRRTRSDISLFSGSLSKRQRVVHGLVNTLRSVIVAVQPIVFASSGGNAASALSDDAPCEA